VRPLRATAAAKHVITAAYPARDSLVRDHPSVSRDAVARFTRTLEWLRVGLAVSYVVGSHDCGWFGKVGSAQCRGGRRVAADVTMALSKSQE
jgi:hypothetical protein